MSLVAHNLTANRRTNEAVTVTVPIYSSEPGVVTASAAGCTFPDGETVTIAGTRAYAIPNDNGAYLALQTSALSSRLGVTILGKTSIDLIAKMFGSAPNAQEFQPLIYCVNESTIRRVNWGVNLNVYRVGTNYTARLYYNQSADSGSSDVAYAGALDSGIIGNIRWAIVLPASGTTVPTYMTSRSNLTNITRAATSGTMGGSEVVVLQAGQETAIFAREMSNSDLDLWFAGTLPATPAAAWMGGHEIVESAPKIWDTAGTYDLGDYDVYAWQAANMRALKSDSVTVVPASSIRVTIPAAVASPVTLSLSRPRAGVPSRASAGEKYETTTGTITLSDITETIEIGPDIDCKVDAYPATIPLLVACNYDGAATVASDDAAITPESPITISNGYATCDLVITEDVTGATITVTGPGGTTATATVTVAQAATPAETLDIGPDTSVVVNAYPATVKLLVASNTDGAVNIASNNAALVPTTPVTVADGQAEVTCTLSANVSGATVTASRTGISDTCSVTVSEVLTPIKIGPSMTVRRGSTSLVLHVTGEDGTVTLASTPAGLQCPASATVSSGEVDVTIPILSSGTYTVTASRGALSDTAVIVVPAQYTASTDYDLVRDIADVIEACDMGAGNLYHYDEIVIDDDGRLDSEDRVFSIRVTGSQEGPIVGGKTISAEVAIVAQPQALPAEVEAVQNYVTQDAEWPAYVGACVCNTAVVQPLKNGDLVIYNIEVILG